MTVKVLAVTPYYAPEGGGLERYADEILSRLSKWGHEVHTLTFTTGESGRDIRKGVTVDRYQPTLQAGNAPVHPAFPVRVHRRLQRDDPDVVLAHTPVPFPAEAAYLAAARDGTPFVPTFHAGRLRGSSPLLDALAALDRWTLQGSMIEGADHRIAVSEHVKETALEGHDDVTVVPPGVDHQRFSPAGERRDDRILFVAPLDSSYRWKGLDVLLEALPIIRRRRPHVELQLVGEGDRRAELSQRAAQEDLPLILPGRLSESDLVDAYRQATVTVLPSTSDVESFGMVLAEANACGCPVVGSDIGGIPALVRDGENGLLARPGDPNDLADRLLRVIDRPAEARRMGRTGREIVRREYDWDRLAERTQEVLRGVAEDGADPDVPAEARPRPRAGGAEATRQGNGRPPGGTPG